MKKLELIEGETLICDGCYKRLKGSKKKGFDTAWLLDDQGRLGFVQPYCEACMLERYDKA